MYKVKPDGSIECLTAQEAVDLQRLIQSAPKAPLSQPRKQRLNGSGDPALEIAQQLRQFNGTAISSAQLVPIIGATSGAGVGPKLYQLRKRIPLDDHVDLKKHRDEKGVVSWRVRIK